MARVTEWVRDPRWRLRVYGALAVVLAVLCLVPQPYEARAKLVPQEPGSLGLGSTMNALGGQLGGFAALLGGAKQPIDLYLTIARGREVADAVIARLKLADRYGSERKAQLALAKKVDVHSLTGGVIEIETRSRDAEEAQALTRAYVAAVTDRLNALSRDRVIRKQQVVRARFREAGERVVKAEAALQAFRRRNRLAEPEAQLGAELSLRAGLQAQLQAKQVELQTLRQFQGDENPQLRAVQSEVAALRAQIARTADPASGAAGPNVAGLSEVSGAYLDLYRDYRFAQALYEVYARSSEEIAVEALAAETASDAQVIEAPRLDADRKYNVPAVALLVLVIALALFTEVYAPATGIRLPLLGESGR
ncbi:capsule biosynthesis protein [Sphingomonas sp.]|jgi:capsule polysaccharide export protein KpsE/RkpR|uniref:capsule biosynthesis protein n=1 Tax=Sphingomonas sp. TaxID=28214 RepID=UPI00263056E8|nr:capsule biosynthesis protein [Sphingomonas sp.]MDF2603664.1 capsule biosynthesis protein [Sphingomonas sp.]